MVLNFPSGPAQHNQPCLLIGLSCRWLPDENTALAHHEFLFNQTMNKVSITLSWIDMQCCLTPTPFYLFPYIQKSHSSSLGLFVSFSSKRETGKGSPFLLFLTRRALIWIFNNGLVREREYGYENKPWRDTCVDRAEEKAKVIWNIQLNETRFHCCRSEYFRVWNISSGIECGIYKVEWLNRVILSKSEMYWIFVFPL